MKAYWEQLSERDRWALGIGVGVLVLYVFYMSVVAPLHQAVAYQKQQLLVKQETLAWMQKASLQYQPKRLTRKVSSGQLLAILATELKTTSIQSFSYQLQQTGQHDIQLSFEKVPYQPFLRWLWKVSDTYAITIKQLSIQPATEQGVVKLTLVLAAAP